MPENYDNPPASESRRPSLPNSTSGIRRRQQLLDHLRARHQREQSARDLERAASEEDDSELDGLISDVQLEGPISQIWNRLVDQDPEGTPRDNRPPQRPRDRMLYLRNLIHSEAHRTDSEATLHALETLNREIEDHYLDEARNGNMTFTQAQAALDDHRRMFGVDNPRSATPTFQQYVQRLPSTVSPANLEPRTPSNRTIRRRPFRPDLRDSFPTPSLMPQTPSGGRDRERDRDLDRRMKRRKLDSDDNREGSRGFNYGHQGQVVPGPLKMEIASCDGGIYDTDGDCSFPDNVLRSDQSVYSTKSDRCNLILRHKGEAPFCLKKIVIKAPRASFDTPIQEGMVFVSMTSDELLARTAQYQIQYSNRRHRRRERRLGLQPSQEYLNPSARPHTQPIVERTILVGPDSSVASTLESAGQDTPDPQTEFRVTTDYNDTTDENVFVHREDDDMLPSVSELERVNEEDDLLCSDSEDDSASDDDEDDNSIHNLVRRRRLENQRRVNSIRRQALETSQRRRPPPSLVDPIPPPSHSTPPAIPASNAEVPKPYARFFIEREKSMVSIKFDPPPSGRFILIKLWSPRSGTNIDVQSIIAHGYAGPRFFPSGGFR